MNRFYMKELDELRNHFLLMAERSISAVGEAMEALRERDADKARLVRKKDDAIDQLELLIDAEATRYLTLRAPVATDVRFITLALKTSHDLERIGDEAANIAKRVIRYINSGNAIDLGEIPAMADLAIEQVRAAISCFIDENPEMALEILPKDKAIDKMHRANSQHLIQCVEEQPQLASSMVDLIFISKALERIGDHAKNIAEEIVFLFQGQDIRHSKAKGSNAKF